MNEKILQAIKQARDTKKRNFKQTFALAINLRNLDLKKPENKIKAEIALPHGLGKIAKIGIIADVLIGQAKDLDNVILIRKDELDDYGRNKKLVKKLANECRCFVAESTLMPLIGKNLGQILAPRNMMPRPIPQNANLKQAVENSRSLIRVALKDSPVINTPVGTEDMADEKIAENMEKIITTVIELLPKGKENIKNFAVKLTMGKAVKFEM